MTNRKHSATGNAGEATSSQEQVNALYTAHQVHTLANLIYRRMTTGFGSSPAQSQPAGQQPWSPGDATYGAAGQSPWFGAGAPGTGATQDMNAAFGAMHGGSMNPTYPFDFASYGATQHPYFGAQFGFHPGSPFGFTGGYGTPGFASTQNPFGFTGFGNNNPYFATQGFGGAQSAFGYVPFGAMYGTGHPFGFVPSWMFANHAAMQHPFGFVPQWGLHSGNTMHDAGNYMNAACTPRNAGFSPAPALFYWYP